MRILRRVVSITFLLAISLIFAFGSMLLAQSTPDNSCDAGGGYTGPTYRVGKDGVTAPRIIRMVDPEYTEKTRRANIQGTARLALVVDASGNPTKITVCEGLGNGLDEKATEAVQQWTFEPGTMYGKAIPVHVAVEVDFHLRK